MKKIKNNKQRKTTTKSRIDFILSNCSDSLATDTIVTVILKQNLRLASLVFVVVLISVELLGVAFDFGLNLTNFLRLEAGYLANVF